MYIDKDRIDDFLTTTRFGREMEVHDWLPSTNDRLLSLIKTKEDISEGYLIISHEQKVGRGRQGRIWHSPSGGVYLSLLLKLNLPQDKWNSLHLIGMLAVYDTILDLYNLNPTIKWPNDLLIKGEKISGILLETRSVEGFNNFGVLGIGINANIAREEFPDEVSGTATSLLIRLGEMVDMNELIGVVLNNLEVYYNELIKNTLDVRGELEERRTIIGRRAEIMSGEEVIVGRVMGFGENGSVIIEVEGGSRREIIEGNLRLMD